MTHTPVISVIIPVYNVEPWLLECLDSICAQTFTDWECICVDDGSTDSSLAILNEFATKDNRFRVIRREHSNAGACRNAGMDRARGKFLQFLDSDDVFSPGMLETMLSASKTSGADIAVCKVRMFHDGKSVPRLPSRARNRVDAEYANPATSLDIFHRFVGRVWDKLFRKATIDRHGLRFQEIRTANDTRFVYCALALAGKVAVVDVPLVAYRISGGSLERTRSKSPECLGEAILSLHEEFRNRGLFRNGSMLETHLKKWTASVLFWNLDSIDTAAGCERSYVLFSKMCGLLSLRDLLPDIREENPDCADCLDMICKGFSPFEYLWFRHARLRRELAFLRHGGLLRRALRKIWKTAFRLRPER